jgi:hypothetical protein
MSALSAYAADIQSQIAIANEANADVKAQHFDVGCAAYGRLYAETDGFHTIDSHILASTRSITSTSALEEKTQTYIDGKQYAHACIDAYVLAVRYIADGNGNAAVRSALRALDMEAQTLAVSSGGTPISTAAVAAVPASTTQATPQPPASTGEGAGVADWNQIAGTYVCQSYGYTGGMQNVGGMLQPVFGLVPAGINVSIASASSYQAHMAGKSSTASFSFSRSIPGGAKPGMLGVIEFTGGSLAGRRALLQDDKQFRHAIIFPSEWKMPDGKSDSLTAGATWCYQGN